MPQKQTFQIPIDDHTSVILDLYVLRSHYNLSGREGLVGTVCEDKSEGIRIRPRIWIIRAFSIVATIIVKTISWLNNLGRGEIDTKRMDASHNHHLGLRIRGMDR